MKKSATEIFLENITKAGFHIFTFLGIFVTIMCFLEEKYNSYLFCTLLAWSLSTIPMKLYEYLYLKVSKLQDEREQNEQ